MKARINDPPALRAITPVALTAYLRGEGWHRVERFGEHSDVFARGDDPELVVPGTDALADYADVVASIIKGLSVAEGRDELQVYRDLTFADRDVVRVRAPEADDDGSVAVDDGVEIVAHARDLLLAAACSATEARPAYRAGRVKDAGSYMERVRLGQTEQGSFVVTLLAPVPPALGDPVQPTFWPVEQDEPFERRVTRRLASGLEAARYAAEGSVRGAGLSAFDQAVPLGVSANLCEALSSLIDRGDGAEVSVTWAKTRLTPEPRKRVLFSRSDGEVFKEAARVFRTREPRLEERLEGFVVDLHREPNETVGRVILRTLIDNRPVSVRADMMGDLYRSAVAAHDQKQPVAITGDLRRDKQRWRLDNPRDFVLTPAEPEDAAEHSD